MNHHDPVARPAMSWLFVDRDVCMGIGQCTLYAPNSFTIDADCKAQVIEPCGDAPEVIRSAVFACPTGALSIATDR
jgi:ferredoxin